MKKKAAAPKRAAWCLGALFVFVMIFLLAQSAWANREDPRLLEDPGRDGQVLLFQESRGTVLLAYRGPSGLRVLALEPDTGDVIRQAELGPSTYGAALKGGSLFVFQEEEGKTALAEYSMELTELSRHVFDLAPDGIQFWDCSPAGALYCVESQSPEVVLLLTPEGGRQERALTGPVEFLETTGEGGLFLYGEGELFFSADGSLGGLAALSCAAPPTALLGENLLLDQDNVICRVERDAVRPLLVCPAEVYAPAIPCPDGAGGLLIPDGEALLRYSLDGEPLGSFSPGGRILGVSGTGLLYHKDDGVYYGLHGFQEEGFSPAPSVSPSPSAPPSPSPPVQVEGEWMVLPAGTGAKELLELFYPDFVLIRDSRGNTVTSGRIMTGMTAGSYTLIAAGDCTGNGLVNGEDVRAAQGLMLEGQEVSGDPYRRAADLDGDGQVTGMDLVLLGAAALLE